MKLYYLEEMLRSATYEQEFERVKAQALIEIGEVLISINEHLATLAPKAKTLKITNPPEDPMPDIDRVLNERSQ